MDLTNYWKTRGENYLNEQQKNPKHVKDRLQSQEKQIVKLLKNKSFNNILEVGCGYGRFTKILYDQFKPDRYLGIDVSEGQIKNAKDFVKNDKIDFKCIKIQDYNSTEKFDLIFSAEVLMHINFSDIQQVIKKLVSLSKGKIVTIDWFNEEKFDKEAGGYCFMHNYSSLFKQNGAKSVTIHKLPLPLSLKIINAYATIKGNPNAETQAIIEVEV